MYIREPNVVVDNPKPGTKKHSAYGASFMNWEMTIKKGNHHFENKDFDNAKKQYLCAKELAQKLFENEINPEHAVPALVVSYHNLADLYKSENEINLAYQELDEIDVYLVNCLDKAKTNLKKANAIRRGIDVTRAELLSFIQKNKIEIAYDNVVNAKKSNPNFLF